MWFRLSVFCWALLLSSLGATQDVPTHRAEEVPSVHIDEVPVKWAATEGIGSLCVSPDGKQIASGGTLPGRARHFGDLIVGAVTGDIRVGGVQIRNAASGVVMRSVTNLMGVAKQVAYSPDGRTLAIASSDWTNPGQVILLDVATGKISNRLLGHSGWVRAIAFAPDGKRIVSGGSMTPRSQVEGGEVWVWDVETGEGRQIWTSKETVVASLDYSPNGTSFATCGEWNVVNVWDAQTLSKRFELKNQHPSDVTRMRFSPDSRVLVTCNDQYGLHRAKLVFWNVDQQRATHVEDVSTWWPDRRNVRFGDLAFSPDGKLLALPLGSWNTGEKWAELRLWNMEANALHSNILLSVADEPPATSAVFSKDGQFLTAVFGYNGLKRWALHKN